MTTRAVITIGNFDGVHIGHAALLARAREAAVPLGARVVAMAFDPHPLTRLNPAAAPPRLTTFERRAELLRECGADEVLRLEPRDELLRLSPVEFVDQVLRPLHPAAIVEGPDFHFGKDRAGDARVLSELGRARGFTVEVVPPVECALTDHQIVTASSTIARWLLANGRVRDATIVLGRPYEMTGAVVRGDQLGRTLGFPTANMATELMPPADGVYGAVARLADGREFVSAVSIGTRPTFHGTDRRVEAFLLDAPEGAIPEYGWELTLRFVGFVRDQAPFDSVDGLKAQMARDCHVVREMVTDRARVNGAGAASRVVVPSRPTSGAGAHA